MYRLRRIKGRAACPARTVICRFLLCALLLASPVVAGGCAGGSQLQRIMPNMTNMTLVLAYFGPPTGSTQLPDGTTRHEWVKDQDFHFPGGRQTVQVYAGHDRDGYRKYVEREVYVPPRTEHRYCRLTVIADPEGRVLGSTWEGNGCDSLPLMRVADR